MSLQGFAFFDEKIQSNLFACFVCLFGFFLELWPQNVQTFFTVGWFHFTKF